MLERGSQVKKVPVLLTQRHCMIMLSTLENIEIHGLWVAGCLLHPSLRSLSFISDDLLKEKYRKAGMLLLFRHS